MLNILQTILKERKKYRNHERSDILNKISISEGRTLPLNDFFIQPGLICELKKASPSKGIINDHEDFDTIISDYIEGGATRFSVLTEQNRFLGHWEYLHELKRKNPELAFLRKDFLFSREDVEESYLLGADAILLIAAMLDDETLEKRIEEAHGYGLQVLCEAHTSEEVKRILALSHKPEALGLNARNLKTFVVNRRLPFALKQLVPADIPVVIESGAWDSRFAGLAGNCGFHAMLVGESVMRAAKRAELVQRMQEQLLKERNAAPNLFTKMMSRYRERPLLKICGITRVEDGTYAAAAGADILGFILARSKRQIMIEELRKFARIDALKVAVVIDPDAELLSRLRALIEEGLLDGVQLHGNESLDLLYSFNGSAIKVITPKNLDDIMNDAYSPLSIYDKAKGPDNDSLHQIFEKEWKEVLDKTFIAGGIGQETIEQVIDMFDPLLIDLASGVEKEPGIKDYSKIDKIISILGKKYG